MKKKILVIALAVAMLALPMISTVQAWGRRRPTEVYDDLKVGGPIVFDLPVKFWTCGDIQFGRYPAHGPGVSIKWDFTDPTDPNSYNHELVGPQEFTVSYIINTDTMKGIARLKTTVMIEDATYGDGTFVGNMFWVGDLTLNADNHVALKFPPPATWTWYTYWRGTGDYAGWTITQEHNFEGYTFTSVQTLTKPID